MAATRRHRAQRRALVVAALAIACALLLVLAAVLVARGYAADRLERSARRDVEQAAQLAASAVEENVARIMSATVSLADDRDLAQAIVRDDTAVIDQRLRRLQDTTASARFAFFVTPDGRATHMHPVDRSVIGLSYAERDWYRGVLKRSPYLSEVYEAAAFEQPRAVTIAAQVHDPSGALIGIITVVVETDEFGRALDRASAVPGTPSITLRDQSGQAVVTGAGQPSGAVISADVPVGDTGWSLHAELSEREAFADLRRIRTAATSFATLLSALLLLVGAVIFTTSRRLLQAQRREERREQAFELNDTIVQRLAVAQLALSMGQPEIARGAVDAALDAGRRIIGELAEGREDYVRDVPAAEERAS